MSSGSPSYHLPSHCLRLFCSTYVAQTRLRPAREGGSACRALVNMKHSGCALAVLLLCLLAQQAACGNTFDLGGDDVGWTNTANIDYNQWLSSYKIKIGDTLAFNNLDSIDHTVVTVDKLGYNTCGASGQVLDTGLTISPGITYSITYTQSGQNYYICSIPGHCVQGMKVAVQVLNQDGSVNQTAAAADAPQANSAPALQWTPQLLLATCVAAVTMFAYFT